MRFLFVEIQNFLSYGSPPQKLSLDKRGLIAVIGKNNDSPGADSNGSGKSSIMEAIVWSLYGTTMRGYKGDECVNRTFGKDCFVLLRMSDDRSLYEVKRSRKSKGKRAGDLTLTVDGVDTTQGTIADTQSLIQTIVGMDFKTFTQSVMMWHGIQPFSRMTDSSQKAVLEDILRIDQLSKARDVAKSRIVSQQQELTKSTENLRFIEKGLSDAKYAIVKLKSKSSDFSSAKALRRKELVGRKLDVEVQLEEVAQHTKLDKLMKIRENLISTQEKLGNSRRNVQIEKLKVTREYANKRSALSRREGVANSRLSQISKDLNELDHLVGRSCPSCRQVLHIETAERFTEMLEKEIKLLRSQEIGAIDRAFTVIASSESTEIATLEARERATDDEWERVQASLQISTDAIHKRTAVLHLICQLEEQARRLQKDVAGLDAEASPYEQLVQEEEEQKRVLERDRRRLSYRIKSIEIELNHLNYWNHGFGNQGLKSYILDSVVPFLTERAQSYADVLSGGSLTISFATRTQLKDGSWREKFQVKAVNSQGADVYHGNSDGERRRIDISVGWALADLAATRADKPIYFRGLDEPFEHLDVTGEDLVIKLLHKVLPQYETVMCVTHSSHLRDQFPEEILVTFDGGFSTISGGSV